MEYISNEQIRENKVNQFVSHRGGKSYPSHTIVHAKLEMTEPGDADELEADAVASEVINGGVIRREISQGGVSGGIAMPANMEGVLSSMQGGGMAMPGGLKNMMENGFNRDFSQVRLHTGTDAAQASSSINAKAFTYGNDIYFNQGQFSPHTSEGQRLVAHELTHVVQGSGKVGREDSNANTIDKNIPIEKYKKQLAIYEEMLTESFEAGDLITARWINQKIKELRRIIEEGQFHSIGMDFSKRFNDLNGATRIPLNKDTEEQLGKLGEDWGTYQPQNEKFSKSIYDLINSKENMILVFSGHHYAQVDFMIGRFTNSNSTKVFDVFELPGTMNNVKLIISTSCATTCIDPEQKSLKSKFPNAIILGFRKSAPLTFNQLPIFKTEINKIRNNNVIGIDGYVEAWKKASQSMSSNEARRRMPAVWHADDRLEYYDGKEWKTLNNASQLTDSIDDGGNVCVQH